MDKLLLKIPEVCEVTGLGRSTVYQLLDQPNGLPTVRIGRAVRVPASAVREWADGRTLVEVEFTANVYDPFFNVNRPQDLGRAEAILTQLD